jgi:hypothetical protein
MDFQVDAFGSPTYVRLAAPADTSGFQGGFLVDPSAADDERFISRDSVGRAIKIVRARSFSADADSVLFHYDAYNRVDTLIRSTLKYPTTSFTLDTLTFSYDSVSITNAGKSSRLRRSKDPLGGLDSVYYVTPTGGQSQLVGCLPKRIVPMVKDSTRFSYGTLLKGDAAGVRPTAILDAAGLTVNLTYGGASGIPPNNPGRATELPPALLQRRGAA